MTIPTHEQAPQPAGTSPSAEVATTESDSPVRVLVQTRTHLVPGHKYGDIGKRIDDMQNLICQHVWQRDYDEKRERAWKYRCELAVDNVQCWFLIDHHGPDPTSPPPDPPVVWYSWTGAELLVSSGWLPALESLTDWVLQCDDTRPAPS